MKKINKLFQKEFSLKGPLSAIHRKTIVLLTGFILLLTCTITGCGSNNKQQSMFSDKEPILRENPVQEELAQEEPAQDVQNQSVPEQPDMEQPSQAEANQSEFSPSPQPAPEKVLKIMLYMMTSTVWILPNIAKALKPQMIFHPSIRALVWKRWEFSKILFR